MLHSHLRCRGWCRRARRWSRTALSGAAMAGPICLAGASPDKKVDWTYSSATGGNVAQMGWRDLGDTGTSISFNVVLSFDSTSASNSMQTAAATLDDNLDDLRSQ